MNITVTAERPQNDQVVAKLTVPAAEVDKAIKQAYKDIAKAYNFTGFRRGHAPRPVIDSIVGRKNVLGQATEDLMNDAQPQMFEELDVVPVGNPDYGEEPLAVVEHEDFTCTATISVPPVAELDSYDAPAINMPPQNATEAEIDQQIEQLMEYHVTYEDDNRRSVLKEGDVCTMDVKKNEGNAAIPEGEDVQVSINDAYLPQEFFDAVKGMKKGETKDVEWTTTHGDHEHKYSYTATLKVIKKKVVPELTDDFAKKSFGFDTIAEFRDAVKEEIEEDKKTSLPNLKEDRVVEEIGKHLQLEEVPGAYENQVFSELGQEFLNQLQRQGLTLDFYLQARGIKADDFINDLHEQAKERARQSLALDALARHLEVEVSDEDIQKEFEDAGVKDVQKSIKDFTEGGQMPAIRESIRRSKAVQWMVENCSVTEVDEIAEARDKKDE